MFLLINTPVIIFLLSNHYTHARGIFQPLPLNKARFVDTLSWADFYQQILLIRAIISKLIKGVSKWLPCDHYFGDFLWDKSLSCKESLQTTAVSLLIL